MSFRIEKKYNIHPVKLPQLYTWLDKSNAENIYKKRRINSLYLENENSTMFKDSVEGSLPRKKIRIRKYGLKISNYNNSNLECKINSVEGRFKKITKIISADKILKYGFFDKDYGNCLPKIEISYNREYFKIFNNIRLTLDTAICYKRYNKNFQNYPVQEDKIILEAKTNDTDYTNFINENIFFEETRFSKYCNAFEKIF